MVTSDGVLVCRHEPEIGGTTDVASHPEFAVRKTTKMLDGVVITGWFAEDFTLAELKTLRAVERLPQIRQQVTLFNGRYEIPTFQEVLDLRARLSGELRRRLGVYPETKHPTFFRNAGLALEPRLLECLRRNRLNHPDAPVFLQSFEVTSLKQSRAAGLRTKAVQLLAASGVPFDTVAAGCGPSYADLSTPAGLRGVARYAQGIGPDKLQVIPRRADGTLAIPPRWSTMPMTRAWSRIPTHSVPRTISCRSTTRAQRRAVSMGGQSTNRSPIFTLASTGCSPTKPTSASPPAPSTAPAHRPFGALRPVTRRRRRTPGLTQ